jgi:hypothetical protein
MDRDKYKSLLERADSARAVESYIRELEDADFSLPDNVLICKTWSGNVILGQRLLKECLIEGRAAVLKKYEDEMSGLLGESHQEPVCERLIVVE